ncbi:MAG: diguanylate cyclase [Firmicutes bacterium]|nr:diguanylate cyclase [Bacillota bacterium]
MTLESPGFIRGEYVKKNIKVGLSSGIVVFTADGNSLDELLAAADRRMYEKRKDG